MIGSEARLIAPAAVERVESGRRPGQTLPMERLLQSHVPLARRTNACRSIRLDVGDSFITVQLHPLPYRAAIPSTRDAIPKVAEIPPGTAPDGTPSVKLARSNLSAAAHLPISSDNSNARRRKCSVSRHFDPAVPRSTSSGSSPVIPNAYWSPNETCAPGVPAPHSPLPDWKSRPPANTAPPTCEERIGSRSTPPTDSASATPTHYYPEVCPN